MPRTQGKNRERRSLRKLGIMTVELDVSDDASVEAASRKCWWRRQDRCAVNNAGIMSAGVTEAFTAEQRRSFSIRMSSGSFASPAPCSLHAPEA